MEFYSTEQERVRLAQRALNELNLAGLVPDGVAGALTFTALHRYQTKNGLQPTGLLDETTWAKLGPYANERFLTNAAIVEAALAYGIQPTVLMAVCQVEGSEEGFLSDGRPSVVFERHKFHLYVTQRLGYRTAREWGQKYPNLCATAWSQSAYKGGAGEWDRLDIARMLDATCALLSCSWGMFRIMGFNYALAGYACVQDFVQDMNHSEQRQLTALLTFIKHQPLFLEALRTQDFKKIALLFNGKDYASGDYHLRLTEAAQQYTKYDTP